MIRYPPQSLCHSFRRLSTWTAGKLRDAARLGVAFSEETITESLLLKLAQRHPPPHFKITSWSKADEGTGTAATGGRPTGADWDFCFADWTGSNVTVRVQAKRQYPSGKYEGLDGTGKQIKDLRANCGSALPVFVFYNNPWLNWPFPAWYCPGTCDPRFRGDTAWGCSFAPVPAIPPKKMPDPSDIPAMRPWHCLVCACGGAGGSLPQRVLGSLRAAYGSLGAKVDDRFAAAPELVFELETALPSWARLLVEERGAPDGEDGRDSIGDALDSYLSETGLRGVAFIQQLTPEARE